jgi:hypothetical protein
MMANRFHIGPSLTYITLASMYLEFGFRCHRLATLSEMVALYHKYRKLFFYGSLEEKELTSLDLPLPDMPIQHICAAGADRGTWTRGDAAAS